MRRASIGSANGPAASPFERWVASALSELERASHEQVMVDIAEAYTVTNYTVSRTLNAGTATTQELADFVATLIDDLKAGEVKRG